MANSLRTDSLGKKKKWEQGARKPGKARKTTVRILDLTLGKEQGTPKLF